MLYEVCFARGGIFGSRSWMILEGATESEIRSAFMLEHPNDVLIDIEQC